MTISFETEKPSREIPQILVAEDSWMFASMAQMMLEKQGCRVIGPVGTLREAADLARTARLSGAMLDVSLGQDRSYAVAAILHGRNIPFAFVTGYSAASLPDAFRASPCFAKPYSDGMVERFLRAIGLSPISSTP
jgi:CheY-like chemotaxis protein